MEIENVKITKVSISMSDYGCLTFWLTLEGYGWGVGYGGYCIGKGYLGADEFSAENGGGLVAMMRIMDTVGVEKWEDLVGKYCRVQTEGWGGKITTIGNIMNDKWFDIDKFFKEYKEQEKK
jgi:anti-sigma regulatory factor (Ser/Thr protein kinase)